ncbi:MAG: iron-sulfur cluster carrier protein ApbC [Rhodospirillaceae bacterium]|jgi:ATP-binding protein involved in chromosome partitioning|nr:iron-sulfur cluster carrier protein ApbC [Rhodospirillaceae bacterium]MBT7266888.1 iron-sulfur cluster carrier protein ApbC [Rhodospirillaceae bacterium]
MAEITAEQVLAALKNVNDPDKGENIVDLDMIVGLQLKDGHVAFGIEVEPERGAKLEPLRKAAEMAVHDLPGVLTATVVLTAERPADAEPEPEQPRGGPPPVPEQAAFQKMDLLGIDNVIAVASGKGGVGKSTTAVNLALAMATEGKRVGLLDADIYGPSIPRMLGITEKPTQTAAGLIAPLENYGIKCMSIGFLIEEETAMIWRGPMATGALEQLITDVAWGELDCLVLDLPPGTGDIHLTMAQRVPLAGAVIVSTPQDIALADARKGLNMFEKVDVPVLGLVENMSYFSCPHCGERTEIFSHGGARKEAEKLGMDFLGEIPLDIVIRETSDDGQPIVASDPSSEHTAAYLNIAAKVWSKIDPN